MNIKEYAEFLNIQSKKAGIDYVWTEKKVNQLGKEVEGLAEIMAGTKNDL
jgi:hypothetical protein